MSYDNDNHDAEEIRGILTAVGETVPKLIKEIFASFYSVESGENMGKAIGSMYRELVDSGIPERDALQMAKDYLNTMQSAVKGLNFGGGNNINNFAPGGKQSNSDD